MVAGILVHATESDLQLLQADKKRKPGADVRGEPWSSFQYLRVPDTESNCGTEKGLACETH